MKYYRHFVYKYIYGENEWIIDGWRFSTLEPDKYIEREEKDRSDYIKENPQRPMINYKIGITHEISKDHFEKEKTYTIPIAQYIYGI